MAQLCARGALHLDVWKSRGASGKVCERQGARYRSSCARGRGLRCGASAREALDEARELYRQEKRQPALAKYDAILAGSHYSPSPQERQEAAFHALSLVASYGDVEHAKSRVRDLRTEGLSLASARQVPSWAPLEAAPPVRKVIEKADSEPPRNPAQSSRATATAASASDSSNPLKVDTAEGIDSSVGAIILRVAAVLATMAVGFGVLFFLGLQTFESL